jgi:hypothetical protein
MIFTFTNATLLQELSYLNNGYSYQLIVDSSKEPIKVLKVLKGNKL